MRSAMMVSQNKDRFSPIEPALIKNDFRIFQCDSGRSALAEITHHAMDLVVADESLPDMTGKQFVEALVAQAPFTHCAISSALSSKAFHDAYEGYGILMQLSPCPDPAESAELIRHMETINRLHHAFPHQE